MIRASDILNLRTAAPDYQETERLKALMAQLRDQRRPFFLTGPELDQVFHWKLGRQYGRGKALRDTNAEPAYNELTRATFALVDKDPDYEAELRLKTLSVLRGVDVPVASAILALVEPS